MMNYLKAHRAKDIKRTQMIICFFMYDDLKKHKKIKINKLFTNMKTRLGINQKDFMLSINFLYAMGKIFYDIEKDNIEFRSDEAK